MAEVLEIDDNLSLRVKLLKDRELRRKSLKSSASTRKKVNVSLRKTNMSSGLSAASKKLELGIPTE